MEAVVGMEGNGPSSPDLRDIGRILAADNAVAMDAVVAFMMGCDPSRLRFLQKAKEEGLGDYDLKTVDIIGNLEKIENFKLPPLGGEGITGNPAIQEMLASKTNYRPKVNQDLCTGCGTCVAQCPVSALTMAGDYPAVDTAPCITCFCCQELCPEKAIQLG
jgi:ferredoxin